MYGVKNRYLEVILGREAYEKVAQRSQVHLSHMFWVLNGPALHRFEALVRAADSGQGWRSPKDAGCR